MAHTFRVSHLGARSSFAGLQTFPNPISSRLAHRQFVGRRSLHQPKSPVRATSKQKQNRIRYTANLLIPQDLRERIKRVLYLNAGEELLEDWDRHNDPLVIFGRLFGRSRDSEIERVFLAPSKLYDVRVRLLRWALRRWALRCRSERNNLGAAGPAGLSSQPVIVFLPDFDGLLEQRVAWCQREGGVPLNRFEKLLIRWSFRFRQVTS